MTASSRWIGTDNRLPRDFDCFCVIIDRCLLPLAPVEVYGRKKESADSWQHLSLCCCNGQSGLKFIFAPSRPAHLCAGPFFFVARVLRARIFSFLVAFRLVCIAQEHTHRTFHKLLATIVTLAGQKCCDLLWHWPSCVSLPVFSFQGLLWLV
jgi:hypothetical protein